MLRLKELQHVIESTGLCSQTQKLQTMVACSDTYLCKHNSILFGVHSHCQRNGIASVSLQVCTLLSAVSILTTVYTISSCYTMHLLHAAVDAVRRNVLILSGRPAMLQN
jgi:hypothetical protein